MKKSTVSILTAFTVVLGVAQCTASTLATRFATDPQSSGWQAFGNTSLFAWNATNENLQVTWDSSQPNSYFAHPLGTTLTRTNDFLLTFDLNLDDIATGTTVGKDLAFEIAVGLIHHSQPTNDTLARGSGSAPNIVEFDYFPKDIFFDPSVSTVLISSTTNYWSGGFTFPLELTPDTLYHVVMVFTASDQTLRTSMTRNGVPVGPLTEASIGSEFGDFEVDTVAISSYSDEGQYPGYEGSVLAHGTVDNLAVASPLPVGLIIQSAAAQVAFLSDAAWVYTLESSTNLQNWSAVAEAIPGNGSTLVMQDTSAPTDAVFYRVRADLP